MNYSFKKLEVGKSTYKIAPISNFPNIKKIPYSYRVLLENLVRQKIQDPIADVEEQIQSIFDLKTGFPVSFFPSRILGHDIFGKVLLADYLAYKEALEEQSVDTKTIKPKIPLDIVIDHSLQVDFFGNKDSASKNLKKEYERNAERFSFLRWCSKNLDDVRIVPPGVGICHQVNLEFLSKLVWTKDDLAYPDTLLGTDSHTPMVNAIGVLGWGVGSIEAEVAILGRSVSFSLPEVVGVKLSGNLQEGVTATDLVLTITELLRRNKVVGSFVEFFGSGVKNLSVGDRGTISNMAPEYGCTSVYFPVDDKTLEYLKMTGRDQQQINLVEQYYKEQMLWRSEDEIPTYSRVVELDLKQVVPCVAGPKNPEDKIELSNFSSTIDSHVQGAYGRAITSKEFKVKNKKFNIQDADIFIAAITSCTNTSNPKGMIAAGLVAKKLVEKGLVKNEKVKTSFAPGSQVTSLILEKAGLQQYLDQLGFNVVGFGCTTCNGGSGPLDKDIAESIEFNKIYSTAVLSGNRNFQGRIHPNVRGAYLASPALVVLFSILGNVAKDLSSKTIGQDKNGKDIFLKDVWPSNEEIEKVVKNFYLPELFLEKYSEVFMGGELWDNLAIPTGANYEWSEQSTYFKKPPYLDNLSLNVEDQKNITGARALVLLGDSITTDHISPSSIITSGTPAADYLLSKGVLPEDFNTYTTRRGNHEVAMRATFANLRLRNLMVPEKEGGYTKMYPEEKVTSIFDAAIHYQNLKTPLLIFAGENYGCGSSRDTAAKGPAMLGVRAVIAKSFERIHRSNLIGMGILPLQFEQGFGVSELGLLGSEVFDIAALSQVSLKNNFIEMSIKKISGDISKIKLRVRLDTPEELNYWKNGGILPTVWRGTVKSFRRINSI